MGASHGFDSELLNYQFILNSANNINVSFEFFPPHNKEMEIIFWKSLLKLSELSPLFISITSGVNKNSDYIYNFIQKIRSRTSLIIAPHLTCINMPLQELRVIAQKYWDNGIRHIVALRGDSLDNGHQSTMNHAIDLVILLKRIGDFDISVAAYPEVHPEAINAQSDLLNLKKKIDAGASRAITQFFFNVDKYLRFRDLCVSAGISIPIIPGILPVFNFLQLKRFITFTQVVLPRYILNVFEGLEADLDTQKMIGIVISMEMIKILIREEVKNFHFYTLNRFELTYAICCMLGLKKNK